MDKWTQERVSEHCGEGTLFADGFDDALIGFTDREGVSVALYSSDKCIEILVNRDEMDEEDARDFFYFNVEGAYMGKHTPVFKHID